MTISLIGYGNVAYALANSLLISGHQIVSVHGRNRIKREHFAKNINCIPLDMDSIIPDRVDMVIIAVKDDAIHQVSRQLFASNDQTIFCHTSGSIGMDAIADKTHFGVFYPLQTFSKSRELDFSEIPICINGNSTFSTGRLTDLANSLSKKIYLLTDEERKKAHLAAVMVNNFTNYIVSEAYQMLEEQNLPIQLVQPLLLETCKKLLDNPPDTTQTGPARRNDQLVINTHLEMIQNDHLKESYRILSKAITTKFN
jgi:predicted short-subunit dehydrogenase-like oxidoreductase (DUF2520 family)